MGKSKGRGIMYSMLVKYTRNVLFRRDMEMGMQEMGYQNN